MRRRLLELVRALAPVVLVAAACAAIAQPVARSLGEGPLAAFERASVLPSDPASPLTLSVHAETRQFRATNTPLQALIAFAYDVHTARVVGGPDWIYSAGYHVEAVAPEAFEGEDARELVANMRLLVRGLLFDHFGLEVRREERVQGYVLELAKGAPPLQATPIESGPGTIDDDGRGRLAARGASIAELIAALRPHLDGPVLDRTELLERYDFVLQWQAQAAGDIDTLALALEGQLGLILRAVGREVVVIERVNEPSTAHVDQTVN